MWYRGSPTHTMPPLVSSDISLNHQPRNKSKYTEVQDRNISTWNNRYTNWQRCGAQYVVECRPLNRGSWVRIHFATVSKFEHFRSLHDIPRALSCINEWSGYTRWKEMWVNSLCASSQHIFMSSATQVNNIGLSNTYKHACAAHTREYSMYKVPNDVLHVPLNFVERSCKGQGHLLARECHPYLERKTFENFSRFKQTKINYLWRCWCNKKWL